MIMLVPILTIRQKEILEFLYVGATRNEIAQQLNLSPETIKMHTKNILDKFGIVSVRDGFQAISKYINYYGSTGLGYQTFLKRIYSRHEIMPDLVSSKFHRVSNGYVVNGPLCEHIYSINTTNKILENIKINGRTPGPSERSGDYSVFKMPIHPPILDGESFIRDLSYNLKSNTKVELTTSTIGTPVAELVMEVVFPRGLPKDITSNAVKGVKLLNLEDMQNAQVVKTDNSYILKVAFPESEQRYSIQWNFSDTY